MANFYVVWQGKETGVFNSWNKIKPLVIGYKGALYKKYPTLDQALQAFENPPSYQVSNSSDEFIDNSWCVDASVTKGNPGIVEFRGCHTTSKEMLFESPLYYDTTGNIGEFFAIVHALRILKDRGDNRVLYSDSRTAINWIKKGVVNTTLALTEKNENVFLEIQEAVDWLEANHYQTEIKKWNTREWGEIPADYGRK